MTTTRTTTTISPIPTTYAGCRFRSRIEARWAVFFDTAGIQWLYEPEGFQLPSGRMYLPDFHLPGIPGGPVWLEVKGQTPTDVETAAAVELAASTGQRVFIAFGDIPREGFDANADSMHMHGPDTGDNFYRFCICPYCGAVGIESEGRSPRIECECGAADEDKYPRTYDHPRLLAAYDAARAARFDTPRPRRVVAEPRTEDQTDDTAAALSALTAALDRIAAAAERFVDAYEATP